MNGGAHFKPQVIFLSDKIQDFKYILLHMHGHFYPRKQALRVSLFDSRCSIAE
jgi:hypothetical protein